MPIWGLFTIARPGVILGCRVANGRKSERFMPRRWGIVKKSSWPLFRCPAGTGVTVLGGALRSPAVGGALNVLEGMAAAVEPARRTVVR